MPSDETDSLFVHQVWHIFFVGAFVDVWRLVVVRAIAADVTSAKVISKNEESCVQHSVSSHA